MKEHTVVEHNSMDANQSGVRIARDWSGVDERKARPARVDDCDLHGQILEELGANDKIKINHKYHISPPVFRRE